MKDPVQLSDDLGSRLCDVLSGEGELVSKWVAVAEVIGPDGKRYLRTFCPEASAPWDQIGMLDAALEQARTYWWSEE
jgi:hypothetical protein